MDALLTMADPVAANRLKSLAAEFNSLRDTKLAACGGDTATLAYEAFDLDLGALLLEILPILAGLLTGGFSLPVILSLAKTLIGYLLKDTELANVLFQIIEVLLSILKK